MDEQKRGEHMATARRLLSKAMRDAAVWAWHSKRLFSIVLLVSAVLLGAHYRFHNLQRWE
jgi:hypothetical protein